jgi:DNA-binding response OmpR family regulator
MSAPTTTDGDLAAVAVALHPHDRDRIDELRRRRRPRLLLVATDAASPDGADPLEDWVRLPADPGEVRIRTELLAARAAAARAEATVTVDADGIARRAGLAVIVTRAEEALLLVLLEAEGSIVAHARLEAAGAAAGSSMRLATRVARLRPKLEPLGVAIHAVRGRGYLLEVRPG